MYVNRVRDNMFCYGHDKKGESKLTRYSKLIKIEHLLDWFHIFISDDLMKQVLNWCQRALAYYVLVQ